MDKIYRYGRKNVQDIPCELGVVRIWDATGDVDRKEVEKAFKPLMRTGFVYPYAALMPDHHPGEGSMVGSVIPTRDVLLLSVMGGDLGCGVTSMDLPVEASSLREALPKIRMDLRRAIPTGTAHNAAVDPRVEDSPLWKDSLECGLLTNRLVKKLKRQFASLGGGNHFLELQEDDNGMAVLTLHSGSRYLGVLIKDHYIEAASGSKDVDQRIFRKVPYLPVGSCLAKAYLADLGFALEFARRSRREMMLRAIDVISGHTDKIPGGENEYSSSTMLDVAHNYVAEEKHFGITLFVHRKGAVRASEGEPVTIPGSMGTSSYIAEGRGNEFSFCSCSHGAGRVMSRQAAMRNISDKAFEESMKGIAHDNDLRLKDESPPAYKNIRSVMRGQKDLVRIRKELRPMLSIKGVS